MWVEGTGTLPAQARQLDRIKFRRSLGTRNVFRTKRSLGGTSNIASRPQREPLRLDKCGVPSVRDIAGQGSESPPDLKEREERTDAAGVSELWPDRIGGDLGRHRGCDGVSVERVPMALGVRRPSILRWAHCRSDHLDQEICGSVERSRTEAGEQVVKAKIHVTLKPGILDPQGKAIEHALDSLGFKNAANVRVGKYMELDLAEQDKAKAEAEVKGMCEKLLANTIIEEYRYELG